MPPVEAQIHEISSLTHLIDYKTLTSVAHIITSIANVLTRHIDTETFIVTSSELFVS